MAEGMNDTAGILRVSSAKIEETGYGPVMRVLQSALLSRLLILQLKLTLSDMLQRKYPRSGDPDCRSVRTNGRTRAPASS